MSDICSDILQLNCYAFCSTISVQRLVLREFDTVLAARSILYLPLIYVITCRNAVYLNRGSCLFDDKSR